MGFISLLVIMPILFCYALVPLALSWLGAALTAARRTAGGQRGFSGPSAGWPAVAEGTGLF